MTEQKRVSSTQPVGFRLPAFPHEERAKVIDRSQSSPQISSDRPTPPVPTPPPRPPIVPPPPRPPTVQEENANTISTSNASTAKSLRGGRKDLTQLLGAESKAATVRVTQSNRDLGTTRGIETSPPVERDILSAKLENLGVTQQRLHMKNQFSEVYVRTASDKEIQKLDSDVDQLIGQKQVLLERMVFLEASMPDNDEKKVMAKVLDNVKQLLDSVTETTRSFVPAINYLKNTHCQEDNAQSEPITDPKEREKIEAELRILHTVVRELEESSVNCKELMGYHKHLLSQKCIELTNYNEWLETRIMELETQTDQSHALQSGLAQVNTLLEGTIASFSQMRDHSDDTTSVLTAKLVRASKEVNVMHAQLRGSIEQLETNRCYLDVYSKDSDADTESPQLHFSEIDKDKDIPVRFIKSGTVDKLVERLTYEKAPDVKYRDTFLLTYRSFMTPYQLFEKLVLRYCMTPPHTNFVDIKQTHQTPVRLRVLNVIKTLIDHHFQDFQDDDNMMNAFNSFMDVVSATGLQKMADQLKTLMEKKMLNSREAPQIVFDRPPPDPLHPKVNTFSLMDVDPIELARQITLLEFDNYKMIKPKEFLKQGWTKKDKEQRAPNILQMIRVSNKISGWVYSEIVSTEELVFRSQKIIRFLQVAQECRKLNNFNAVFEIVAGLSNSSVHRLRKTWTLVPKADTDFMESMREMMSNNFKKFREELHSASPPCIPYIGVYLTDLVFIEDGVPDTIDEGLINFSKLRKVAESIIELQQYQQGWYCLIIVPKIRDMLLAIQELKEDDAYNLSLKCEGRTG